MRTQRLDPDERSYDLRAQSRNKAGRTEQGGQTTGEGFDLEDLRVLLDSQLRSFWLRFFDHQFSDHQFSALSGGSRTAQQPESPCDRLANFLRFEKALTSQKCTGGHNCVRPVGSTCSIDMRPIQLARDGSFATYLGRRPHCSRVSENRHFSRDRTATRQNSMSGSSSTVGSIRHSPRGCRSIKQPRSAWSRGPRGGGSTEPGVRRAYG